MRSNQFIDKDISDFLNNPESVAGVGSLNLAINFQLSKDIKELIKALRNLKIEMDGDESNA